MIKFTNLLHLYIVMACLINTVLCTDTKPIVVAMYGNPGSGKSTILSTLTKIPGAFQSGISQITGLTKTHKSITVDNVMYIDTPGLADVKDREQAAQEIEQSLKTNQRYKVFFVVSPTSGRVSSMDLSTIKIIIQSIPEDIKFGIIYNKLTKRIYDQYLNSIILDTIHESLLDRPPHKYLLLRNLEELEEQDNVIPKDQDFNNDLVQFIKEFPDTYLPEEQVQPLPADEYENLLKEMEENHKKVLQDYQNQIKEFQDLYNNSCVKYDTETEERSSPFEREGPSSKRIKWRGLKTRKVKETIVEKGETIEKYLRINCIKGNGQIEYGQWTFVGNREVVTNRETKSENKKLIFNL
ncbi:hypothetical protein CYY_007793 [Polysphondylium violaceum]|uniref:G domain-containing protein n=1 Tax=Polysphondylium violaceum TaxID=133409 RepID=A0A8J4V1X1_9MYCE|nr:hypothetical protein CYY_007793 [Polysphondylium violaceum]